MRYVLDASVAVKWVLTEADTPKALALRDEYGRGVHELIGPDLFPIEIAHALTRAERRGVIKPNLSTRLLLNVISTSPLLYPSSPLLIRACDIASAARIGVYDCLYVALAEREGCELVTADDKLIRNLGAQFPLIVPLAALP